MFQNFFETLNTSADRVTDKFKFYEGYRNMIFYEAYNTLEEERILH